MSRLLRVFSILTLSLLLVAASGCVVVDRCGRTRVYIPAALFDNCFRCFCR